MKDFDKYMLVLLLCLLAGLLGSAGINYKTNFLFGFEYLGFALIILFIGIIVIKEKSKVNNNQSK